MAAATAGGAAAAMAPPSLDDMWAVVLSPVFIRVSPKAARFGAAEPGTNFPVA